MGDTKPSMPAFAKYSVTVMHVTHADLCDEPDSGWPKSDHLVSKVKMEHAFEILKKESGKGDSKEMVRFAPEMPQGDVIRVFFNPSDINSLYVVADEKEIANVFFERLKLEIPYHDVRAWSSSTWPY